MSKNISELPFTEIVERTMEIMREAAPVKSKIRASINDTYVREITRKEDWNFLIVSSGLTTNAAYNVGTVSATTGSTTVTFSSGVTLTNSMSGRKLQITNNPFCYDFTFTGTTSGTISPPLSGNINSINQTYNIFDEDYLLPMDFDRYPKDGGLLKFDGQQPSPIKENSYQEWISLYTPVPSQSPDRCIMYTSDTNGQPIIKINPPTIYPTALRNDYLRRLSPMHESTAGFITVGVATTSVTGSNTEFLLFKTGDFIRVDAFGKSGDSEWYQVRLITSNTSLLISTAFGLSGATSANYTICSGPEIPTRLHPAIMYGAVVAIGADQNDPLVSSYNTKYAEVLSDGKRIYKTRTYSQDVNLIAEDYLYRR